MSDAFRMIKAQNKLSEIFLYNYIIRYFIESYLEIAICSLVNLYYVT